MSSVVDTILTYFFFFFFNDTATTEIYTLSLHDALPIFNFGKHIGEEKNRTKNAAPWQVASHHDSQCQRQGQLQSEREGYNQTYVAERFQKHLIREDVFKVFQPNVIHRRSQAIPIEHAEIDRAKNRVDDKKEKENKSRQ